MPVCLLEWTESMSVEADSLDAEHRKVLAWLRALEKALRAEARPLALHLAERLDHDAREHFIHEEGLLAEYGFPHLKAHRLSHRLAEEWLLQLCRAITMDSPVALEWLQAFKLLFIERLLVEDLQYKWFFLDIGVMPDRAAARPARLSTVG